jgi:MFS family permease
MTIVAHIVWHGEDLGLGEAAAGILVVIGGISIVGRLAVGKISDQFGSRRAIQTCFILLFLSFVFLLTIENPKLLFVFALIYGIAHGGFFTATSPSVAEYFGTRSHGAIFGILVFCGTVGGFVSPPLAGYFFDKTGSYDIPFLILTALSIIGFIVISQLRPLPVALD